MTCHVVRDLIIDELILHVMCKLDQLKLRPVHFLGKHDLWISGVSDPAQ